MIMATHNDSPEQPSRARGHRDKFADFVRAKSKDPVVRSILRKAVRRTDGIDTGVLAVIGGWLPADATDAVIMAHGAAWCAEYHESAGVDYRTVAGELAKRKVHSEASTERLIEGVLAPGAATGTILSRIGRILRSLPDPMQVDLPLLIGDVRVLSGGADAGADRVRRRWYKDYHDNKSTCTAQDATVQSHKKETA